MTFYNDILYKLGITDAVKNKTTIYEQKGLLVEGHSGLESFSDEEIIVKLKKKRLKIIGERLTILEIGMEEIFVKGKIISCEVIDVK